MAKWKSNNNYFSLHDGPERMERICIDSLEYTVDLTLIGHGGCVNCKEGEEESLTDANMRSSVNYNGLELPITVVSIGAFRRCTNLKSIKIPEGIEKIYAGAFADCESLTEIYLPDSLKWLGFGAFSGCKSLSKVSLPETCEINGDPFTGCDLKKIIIENRIRNEN